MKKKKILVELFIGDEDLELKVEEKEEIAAGFYKGMEDALAGNTLPALEFLDQIHKEIVERADRIWDELLSRSESQALLEKLGEEALEDYRNGLTEELDLDKLEKEIEMDGVVEGRVVHYVMEDGQHRAADIVRNWGGGTCNLMVKLDGTNDIKPVGPVDPENKDLRGWQLFVTSVTFNEHEKVPGTWHWIEKA